MCADCEKRAKKDNKVKAVAKKLGHIPTYKSEGGMDDNYICSCGWEGHGFWDGEGFAWDEWLAHAKKIIESGQASLPL